MERLLDILRPEVTVLEARLILEGLSIVKDRLDSGDSPSWLAFDSLSQADYILRLRLGLKVDQGQSKAGLERVQSFLCPSCTDFRRRVVHNRALSLQGSGGCAPWCINSHGLWFAGLGFAHWCRSMGLHRSAGRHKALWFAAAPAWCTPDHTVSAGCEHLFNPHFRVCVHICWKVCYTVSIKQYYITLFIYI